MRTNDCRECGAAFVPVRGGGSKGIYCSHRCHQVWRQRQLRTRERWPRWCMAATRRLLRRYRVAPPARRAYAPVPPRPIECKACRVTFVAKFGFRFCPDCGERRRREAKRRAKERRRAAKRGAVAAERFLATDIYERDGWRCHICRRLVRRTAAVPHPMAPTIDHLIPISQGGADARSNVATAHFHCNSERQTGGEVQLRLVG